MANRFVRRWFEDQLRFRLPDRSEERSVLIGASEFLPVQVLKEFDAYEQEYITWVYEDWKPRQCEIREEILDEHGNRERYHDLVNAVGRQQIVPFVGSGMSAPSGLPTWAEFLMDTGKYSQCDSSELNQLIGCSAFEAAADLLSRYMNSRLFAERVEHTLRINDTDSISGPVCLLPSLFPNFIITTNLDNVLESLYETCKIPFSHVLVGKNIVNYRQLRSPNERFLIKLHGDYKSPDGRILLPQEYDEAYAISASIREETARLYQNNSLLFLGCSLGPDRTVKLLHEIANFDRYMPKHYAFLVKPDDDSIRVSRENFLTERGIYPIWYDTYDHNDSIMALLEGLDVGGSSQSW